MELLLSRLIAAVRPQPFGLFGPILTMSTTTYYAYAGISRFAGTDQLDSVLVNAEEFRLAQAVRRYRQYRNLRKKLCTEAWDVTLDASYEMKYYT